MLYFYIIAKAGVVGGTLWLYLHQEAAFPVFQGGKIKSVLMEL